ncbi:hypothetical protein AVO45_09410 [Ruegeria marisrubri]|uniref:MmeI-like helicase spacer domain-containing protein n=2 Tax=Ruegeria marisrubri TaxID=1685379 RepID=A0A0X3TR35_9RHOB|nr:hypothetical protein AVO45_09410 [Ruegeria marisrubri]
MRCLFSMFAEDVKLIPPDSFTNLPKDMAKTPENAAPMLQELWEKMNVGEFSTAIRHKVLRFNGGLFADSTALPLDSQQIALLICAENKDWKTVEPAIFGTLAHFGGILVRRLAHDAPSYSRVGASGKPGAVRSAALKRIK